MKSVKKFVAGAMIATAAATMAACGENVNDADVVNQNISTDSDNFKINRRVIFINGITDKYLLTIEGFCSLDAGNPQNLKVTCKVGDGYKRHYIGLSDNVTYMVEQLDGANVSKDHYKVTFKPESIIPSFELR